MEGGCRRYRTKKFPSFWSLVNSVDDTRTVEELLFDIGMKSNDTHAEKSIETVELKLLSLELANNHHLAAIASWLFNRWYDSIMQMRCFPWVFYRP